MLDDFTDVSDEEKCFIKLWNAFVKSIPIHIPNKDLLHQCLEFVKMHATVIQRYEEHLICHLITLWEEHQLTRDDILAVMKHYGEVILSSTDTTDDD